MIFFINIGPNLAKGFDKSLIGFSKYLKGNYDNSLFLYDTTCSEVVNEINKMKSKSSSGIDGITSRIVRYVARYIALQLSHIFSGCQGHLLTVLRRVVYFPWV